MKKQISTLLKEAYRRKKMDNRRFSMQLIAKKLGISLPFTSQILGGKRALPPELVEQICDILDIDTEKRDWILRELLKSKKIKENLGLFTHLKENYVKTAKEVEWFVQPKRNFWVLHEWFYLAIMDTTLLADFDGSTQFIADRLSLPQNAVENAINRMLEAGIFKTVNGRLQKAHRFNDFHSRSSKEDIRLYHARSMDKAKEALKTKIREEDVEQRLITTYTMTASRKKIAWAKQQVADFIKYMAAELAADEAEEVYQLGIQLFPLTSSKK